MGVYKLEVVTIHSTYDATKFNAQKTKGEISWCSEWITSNHNQKVEKLSFW